MDGGSSRARQQLEPRSSGGDCAPVARRADRSLAIAARTPFHVAVRVCGASEDEQQIREAIQVADSQLVGVFGVRLVERPCAALRAAGDGATAVQQGAAGRTTRQDEAVQLGEFGVELVTPLLEPVDIARLD